MIFRALEVGVGRARQRKKKTDRKEAEKGTERAVALRLQG